MNLFFEIINSNYTPEKMFNMKVTITKYISVILAWNLFYGLVFIPFSSPGSDYQQERIYQELKEADLFLTANFSNQLQKKENTNRINHFCKMYCSSENEAQIVTPGYLSFYNDYAVSQIHFYQFITSHFATST
jgi:hypothetical protein